MYIIYYMLNLQRIPSFTTFYVLANSNPRTRNCNTLEVKIMMLF